MTQTKSRVPYMEHLWQNSEGIGVFSHYEKCLQNVPFRPISPFYFCGVGAARRLRTVGGNEEERWHLERNKQKSANFK